MTPSNEKIVVVWWSQDKYSWQDWAAVAHYCTGASAVDYDHDWFFLNQIAWDHANRMAEHADAA